MWNGSSSDAALFEQSGPTEGLGLGEMYGWAICNGNNGTPNLSGKFIVGEGSRNASIRNNFGGLTVGASETYTVMDSIGATQVMQQANQVGSHNHGKGGLTHGDVSSGSSHDHDHHRSKFSGSGEIANDAWDGNSLTSSSNVNTGSGGYHNHSISGSTGENSGTQQAMPNRPSYYVVVYLMKL
jgi:hypothetical protein